MVKVGLEIHQQLDCGKLFCNCPSKISDSDPDFSVMRRLRAQKGESGELDKAAEHETQKGKGFRYLCHNESVCLVELDEEPPHAINQNALEAVLSVAELLNAKVLDRIAIMRKTVLDGSNTTGFQRTGLVAIDGHIIVGGKKINVPTVCIEEDAAQIVERKADFDVYNLSRLGIPLIEIATAPEIDCPKFTKEVAEALGMLLRSVPGIKRGLGTIRQDVNVSIPKGARVEIKGAQELKLLEPLVENEIMRQRNILALGIKPLKENSSALGGVFRATKCSIILKQPDAAVLGARLKGMAGKLGKELQIGKRLGTDLSDFAKIRAGLGGLFHSDELPKYGISQAEVKGVRAALKCGKSDAFVLVVGPEARARLALRAVFERLCLLSKGVPKEVRKALPDATTSYLRPMPGAARMYPETDLELIIPKKSPKPKLKLLTDIGAELESDFGLSKDLAKLAIKSTRLKLILKLIKANAKLKPSYIVETVLSAPKQLKKEFNKELFIPDELFEEVFSLVNDSKLSKDVVLEVLSRTDELPLKDIICGLGNLSDPELQTQLKLIISENPEAPFNALMGIAVLKLRGKASGKAISDRLKQLTK
jgi:glutamyl-tRNA(Gln) amidotransferase subunit E